MFITIEHIKNIGISKFENTKLLLCSGTKPFYYFWVKSFDIRKETQSYYSVFINWPLSRAAPMARKFVSPQRAPKAGPTRSASSFNSITFFKFLKSSARFRCVTSLAPRNLTSNVGYCDISEWHVRSVRPRALPPAPRLHLTNPCAEPKCSQSN